MPTDRGMRPVAQMRAHPSARINGGCYLVACRFGVADGNQHAAGHGPANKVGRAVVLRRNGRELDEPGGRVLQPLKLVPVGLPHMLLGMRSAWPVVGTDERPFQVDARNS